MASWNGITMTPVEGISDGAQGNYNGSDGKFYNYDANSDTWTENAGTSTGTSGLSSGTSDSKDKLGYLASDFATTTKLPDWASSFVETASNNYTMPVWDSYQASLRTLYSTPDAIEEGRKSSESTWLSALNKTTADSARSLQSSQAASGTANSSVGTDEISALTESVFGEAITQHAKNATASEAEYQNLVDSATAAQTFSGLVADYLGNTQESYAPALSGLDLTPGDTQEEVDSFNSNNEGSGTWNPVIGLDEGATYGTYDPESGSWTVHNQFYANPAYAESLGVTDPAEAAKYFGFKDQGFYYDTSTGKITQLSSSSGNSIDSDDLAGKSGLSEFAASATQDVIDKYGSDALADSYFRTSNLSAYRPVDAGAKLSQQYGGLSEKTVAALKTALTSAGSGTSALSNANAQARTSAISDKQAQAAGTVRGATSEWVSSMAQKYGVDVANANAEMAGQMGNLLNLARYKYIPDTQAYVDYNQGTST